MSEILKKRDRELVERCEERRDDCKSLSKIRFDS